MKPFEPKDFSQVQIESMANNLLTSYFESIGKPLELPIPIEEIAEFHLGYEIVFTNEGLYSSEDFLGGICFERSIIFVNTALENHEGRLAFTIAHELGHHILHKEDYLKYLDGDSPEILCRDTAKKPLIERQADQFAAAFLMPKDLLTKSWNYPTVSSVYDAYQAAAELKSKIYLSNVSLSALVNRLIDLELIIRIAYQSGPPRSKPYSRLEKAAFILRKRLSRIFLSK